MSMSTTSVRSMTTMAGDACVGREWGAGGCARARWEGAGLPRSFSNKNAFVGRGRRKGGLYFLCSELAHRQVFR